jgi:hypothetical protein
MLSKGQDAGVRQHPPRRPRESGGGRRSSIATTRILRYRPSQREGWVVPQEWTIFPSSRSGCCEYCSPSEHLDPWRYGGSRPRDAVGSGPYGDIHRRPWLGTMESARAEAPLNVTVIDATSSIDRVCVQQTTRARFSPGSAPIRRDAPECSDCRHGNRVCRD